MDGHFQIHKRHVPGPVAPAKLVKSLRDRAVSVFSLIQENRSGSIATVAGLKEIARQSNAVVPCRMRFPLSNQSG
jgi:hypothetical protein